MKDTIAKHEADIAIFNHSEIVFSVVCSNVTWEKNWGGCSVLESASPKLLLLKNYNV